MPALAPHPACAPGKNENNQARDEHGNHFRLRHCAGKSRCNKTIRPARGMNVVPENVALRIAARRNISEGHTRAIDICKTELCRILDHAIEKRIDIEAGNSRRPGDANFPVRSPERN